MKKLLFSVAILAALASCSKNEVDVVQPEQNAITFSTLNDRITKAANDGGDTYQVLALMADDGKTFFNETMTANSTAGGYDTFGTNTTYYWPGEDVCFYAYAPSDANGETALSIDVLSFDYIVPGNKDLTAAYQDASSGSVALTFGHLLSKISFVVVLDTSISGYALTTAEDGATAALTVATTEGTVTLGDAAAIVAKVDDGDPVTASAATTRADEEAGDDTTASYTGAMSYMIHPQDIDDSTVAISGISIATASETDAVELFGTSEILEAINLKNGSESVTTWEAGKHYIYTITISTSAADEDGDALFNAITITSTLTNWDDGVTESQTGDTTDNKISNDGTLIANGNGGDSDTGE